jgi:C-terminal processing protease CtpA/Prc
VPIEVSVLAAAGLLLALAGPADSQTTRLAGLARVWGQVKYVHPAMAISRIDWDAALIRAIPATESAGTAEDYRRAISGLLAELQDPVTRVIEKEPADPTSPDMSARPKVRLEAIAAETAVLTIPNDPSLESAPNLQLEICGRFTEATRFERVVLDLRSPTGRQPGWSVQNAIVKCASRLLRQDVTLAPARFLTHGFYMMQSVTGGAGGGLGPWDSGLKVVSAGSVRGEGARTPRLAFIVNRGTTDLYPLLMGLQAQGLAKVVQEGDTPAAGLMVKTFEIDEELSIAVRYGERLRPDGGAGFAADVVVPSGSADVARQKALALLKVSRRGAAVPGPVSAPFAYGAFVENDYSETPYPDRPHRLLALFRLYNVIDYFYPYKDLMDRPWRETLAEFIPRMRDARDATDYALTVSELATRIQDSHVTLASPVLDEYFGTHRPAVRVDLVEALTVITEVGPELAGTGLHLGDVVVSVDGEDAAVRRGRLARCLPASTRGRLENKIDIQFLLGPRSQPAVLEVRGEDGTVRRASAARTLEGLAPRSRMRTGPVHTVLASGYGYVDLQRLEAAEVDAAFETIRNTSGTVFDMRGYPAGGARAVVPRLARPGAQPAVIGGSMRYDGSSGSFSLEEALWTLEESPPAQRYTGRVVVLADGSSQSAAEHICAGIKSAAAVTFIGSRTSGANGGVTRTILPGGIVVNFTGQSVRHGDGSQLQRVGIVPDVEAHPTLSGIRDGRDDVLERAVDFLSHGK